ncbi:fluoride efflux transporter CrcB [Rhodococcoides yunnanense]|uniref:fluoride efflux transporter CrcB n=1 Tax=Rhodococcoides yunnanense TaxID=278209 RepID=UPI0009FC6525|nr:fluoride efflux transporter CrcB [Rhodococcus yunnanensis]
MTPRQADGPGDSTHCDSHAELPLDPDTDDPDTDDAASVGSVARPLHLQPVPLLTVFVGGVLGTLARYGIETAIPHRSPQWPIATFAINLSGAFVLGLLLANLARRGADVGARRRIRLLAGTGFCGAFTTYSTFALETVVLAHDGHLSIAAVYAVATVILGALAAWAGIAAGSASARGREQ